MNRRQRRKLARSTSNDPIQAALVRHALEHPCDDCTADAAVTVDGRITHINIRHDDTCPSYGAMGGAR